jgi:hypothetical protein
MIKQIIIITLVSLGIYFDGTAQDTYIVEQFGSNMSKLASRTNTYSTLEKLEELISQNPKSAFRISDNIMRSLALQNGLSSTKDYMWASYLTCMQKEFDKGVNISFSNVEEVPQSLIPSDYQGRQELSFVSCHIQMTGASNFNENDLFVLVNGKIAKIQDYQVGVDKNGRRKLRIDLSGLDLDWELEEENGSMGLTYNYSKAFPVGVSFYGSKWKFMASVDFGMNFNKDIYTTRKVDFNNLMDYKITYGEFDPKYYVTVTPSFYLKYFSVGWGVGMLILKGKETIYERNYQTDGNGNPVVTIGGPTIYEDVEKAKFMMRPNIRGFIPCNDLFAITVSVSYNWIQGYKEMSGIDFGVGAQLFW